MPTDHEAPRDPPPDAPPSAAWVDAVVRSVTRRSPEFQRAWARLEARYRDELERLAARLLGPRLSSRMDVADVLNEAWARAFRHLDAFTYRGPLSFLHWMRTEVRRVVAEHGRVAERRGDRERRTTDLTRSETADVARPAAGPGPASEAASAESGALLTAALDDVPEPFRTPLRRVFLEQEDKAAVAASLGRLPNTLAFQLRRGLELWRSALERRHDPGSFGRV